jgi:hypothetical protein
VHKFVKLPGLAICAVLLSVPAAFAQEAGGAVAPAPATGTNPGSATPMEAGANAASANTAGAPVVNRPDPQNAGTLAESARTTALATYPWSTADIWFGR